MSSEWLDLPNEPGDWWQTDGKEWLAKVTVTRIREEYCEAWNECGSYTLTRAPGFKYLRCEAVKPEIPKRKFEPRVIERKYGRPVSIAVGDSGLIEFAPHRQDGIVLTSQEARSAAKELIAACDFIEGK